MEVPADGFFLNVWGPTTECGGLFAATEYIWVGTGGGLPGNEGVKGYSFGAFSL